MSTHKNIDKICIIAVVISLILSSLLINGEAIGIEAAEKIMGYESRLFDTSEVHTIDIVMENWDEFIESCTNEEYSECSIIIDGECYKNIAIRAKGNTSLSSVSSMDSNRYSFKVEFDHYDSNKTYHGLDKLSLNNIIQDNTYMKDYLTYQMMYRFGVDAPLSSYAFITVNGKDWGLYLAVEGIEDSFIERNYGNNSGELYKPDSMSFGGGRGNGKDFNPENFFSTDENGESTPTANTQNDFMTPPNDFNPDNIQNSGMTPPEGFNPGNMQNGGMIPPQEFDPNNSTSSDENKVNPFPNETSEQKKEFGKKGGFGGGMGSNDVKLQYIDDNPESYSNIFGNAKTDISENDKKRLINSLKNLTENTNIEETIDIEEVIRYFVVHNFVCNGDSYTGNMIHNYYLYEKDGKLSMIPWDYNLAYGTFQGGNAESEINAPIDSPVSGGNMSDRPMISWIFENEEYTELYHNLFSEFIAETNITEIISETEKLISPYVERDPTKFCTFDEFKTGVSTLTKFCELRTESVSGQLNGSIPSTSDGQSLDSSSLINADGLILSDMGTMTHGGENKGNMNINRENRGNRNNQAKTIKERENSQ